MKKQEVIRLLKGVARANGCTCDPWISVVASHGEVGSPGSFASIDIAHDDWCKHERTASAMDDPLTHAILAMGKRN